MFLTGNGFDPGANINPDVMSSEAARYGRISDPNQRHNQDLYGFPVEMDPGRSGRDYLVDAGGGLWFGTDSNFKLNGTADAVYYLDLDVRHKTSPVPTYGRPFRVAAGPSDAEATGPALNATRTTLFFNVQQLGEQLGDKAPAAPGPGIHRTHGRAARRDVGQQTRQGGVTALGKRVSYSLRAVPCLGAFRWALRMQNN